jgi:hypothetical protein
MKKIFKDPDFMLENGVAKNPAIHILDWIYLTYGEDAHDMKDFIDRSIKLWHLEEQNVIKLSQNPNGTQVVEYPDNWTWQEFLHNIGIEGEVKNLFIQFSTDPNVQFSFPYAEDGTILDFNNTTF